MSGTTPGVVTFDYGKWAARYPELASSVGEPLAQAYFDNDVPVLFDNSPTSPVQDLTKRAALLNMIVAHVAALNAPLGGQAATPLVGRISSATEGSVTVQAEMAPPSERNAYWMQTKYGAAFWQATASLRLFQHVPAPQPVFDPRLPFTWRP
jgi:uncharacterized protein DUF4054